MNGESLQPEAAHDPKPVEINYGGDVKKFPYDPAETVGQLLAAARERFHVADSPHLLGLFPPDSESELTDALTLREAGVKPGARLVMRQSIVRGG